MTSTTSPDLTITVYSKPNCSQCVATYRKLDRAGVAYTKVDFTKDPEATAFVMASGFQSAPIVVTADDTWSGFRDGKLTDFIAKVAAAAESAEDRVQPELVAA